LLHIFDAGADGLTLRDIRSQFSNKFKTFQPLLNQNFGIYRLLPLILIKEEYKNQGKSLSGDVATIKVIRDAIAHGHFAIDENGYTFENKKDKIVLSYNDFPEFLHRIENEFYSQSNQ
jgi:hypothetical protein